MRPHTLRLVLASSCFLIGSVARAQEAKIAPASPKPASVPFEILKTKHLAVQIKVNGKGPYRVIFDTGAPVTVLSNKIAQEAELIGKDVAKQPAFFGMRGQMKIKTLEVGDLKAENISVIVMDHPAVKAAAQVLGPLEGIVGFPFFARYRMAIDYQASTLSFTPVDYQPVDLMDNMMLMMMNPKRTAVKKHLSPATVWGFAVDKEKKDEEPGVEVKHVLPGSAAATAGLKEGDRLLVLDGTWTDAVLDCHRAVTAVRPGQTVKLRLRRGDKEIELSITPPAGL